MSASSISSTHWILLALDWNEMKRGKMLVVGDGNSVSFGVFNSEIPLGAISITIRATKLLLLFFFNFVSVPYCYSMVQ